MGSLYLKKKKKCEYRSLESVPTQPRLESQPAVSDERLHSAAAPLKLLFDPGASSALLLGQGLREKKANERMCEAEGMAVGGRRLGLQRMVRTC
ncbi:Regulator Of Nonsense Transcripts 3A [Manis pentadactyla]|nr:Regulator Of Nonsense Transcripts 3A [Manis pentadactyla]